MSGPLSGAAPSIDLDTIAGNWPMIKSRGSARLTKAGPLAMVPPIGCVILTSLVPQLHCRYLSGHAQ